jgi:hypothetical protein
MQSVIAFMFGAVLALGIMLLTKGAIMSGAPVSWSAIIGWTISLWSGVFLAAFLSPMKNATWLKSKCPPWGVATIVLTLGALVYGPIFHDLPFVLLCVVSMLMSAGCVFVIWLAPKVSKRAV